MLSDSTEAYDRGKKFEHYGQIPSCREYLLVTADDTDKHGFFGHKKTNEEGNR